MARPANSGRIDLHEVFRRVQAHLLAGFEASRTFEHPTAQGAATEALWLDLFARYLPSRFRAAPAFVINAQGRRSRQIDIAIYDHLHAPPLFPHEAGIHLPVESVYAIFEVKAQFTAQWIRDAGAKAASVRALCPARHANSSRPILAGLLAPTSVWTVASFPTKLTAAIAALPPTHALQYGCALQHGAFEALPGPVTAPPDQALIFFLLRFLDRLNSLGPRRAPNLRHYL